MILSPATYVGYLQASGVMLTPSQKLLLESLIPDVESVIQNALGWRLEQSEFTEFYPMIRSNAYDDEELISGYEVMQGVVVANRRANVERGAIFLDNIPVRSITSIYENTAAWYGGDANGLWPAASLLPAAGYHLDLRQDNLCWSGALIRNTGTWPNTARTVKVTYVAGLTEQELATTYASLRMACLITLADSYAKAIARARQAVLGGTVNSITIEDFSITLGGTSRVDGGGGAGGTYGRSGGPPVTIPGDAMARIGRYINLSRYFPR